MDSKDGFKGWIQRKPWVSFKEGSKGNLGIQTIGLMP
jgi:hypothetical protein